MFGYVRIIKDELKIREYHHFRSYYCGLCRALKTRYGPWSTLLLNYDVTFLSLFLTSLTGVQEKTASFRCLFHPTQKRLILVNNKWLDYGADINLLLAYHNLQDNWQDEHQLSAGAGLLLLSEKYKRAARLHPVLNQIIVEKTRELARLENAASSNIDETADTFAKILENICPVMDFPSATQKAIQWFCYNLGKWIYLIDALDDLEENLKKKQYNPFIAAYYKQGEDFSVFHQQVRSQAGFVLQYTLSQISQSYELLDIKANRGILDNIIYLGMNKQTERVLNQRSCSRSEQKLSRNSWCAGKCFQRRNP
jgi:hypothetical protein